MCGVCSCSESSFTKFSSSYVVRCLSTIRHVGSGCLRYAESKMLLQGNVTATI